MANKPTASQEVTQELPPAMDYAQHEQTYRGFVTVTKYSVLIMAISMVLLYFIIRP
jgi:hypothetical protein